MIRMTVRTTILAFSVLAACACRDLGAQPKEVVSAPELNRASTAGGAVRLAEQPAKIVDPRAMPRVDGAVGALERPRALRRFFDALTTLEDNAARSGGHVAIVQFGDSHTAADLGTAVMRSAFSARFGDGGRGYVPIGLPYSSFRQEHVRGGMTKDWIAERPHFVSKRERPGTDARHGLLGYSIVTNRSGARAWTEISTSFDRIDVSYLEQPGGGTFEVFVDDMRKAVVKTRGPRSQSAFHEVLVTEGPHKIEIRSLGDGEVRMFGATIDRTAAGTSFDALGINGARVSELLRSDETHFTEQLRRRNPALVVFAYGTNESGDDTPSDVYERQIVDALGRIARAVPTASCLILGPPDRAIETKDGWLTSPKLLDVIAAQRRVAEAAGCAYYSQFDAMGGEGSIATWSLEDPPRGGKDRVHLTRDGYAQLGAQVSGDLLRAYEVFRGDRLIRAQPKPMTLK